MIASEHGDSPHNVFVLPRHDHVIVDAYVTHAPASFAHALRAAFDEGDQTDEFVAVKLQPLDLVLDLLREELAEDCAFIARVARQVLQTWLDDVMNGASHACGIEDGSWMKLEGWHGAHGSFVDATSGNAVSQLPDESFRAQKSEERGCRAGRLPSSCG